MLYLGSNQERGEIMEQLSEEGKKMIQNRYNFIRLLLMKQTLSQGGKYIKDQGKFKDLNQNSRGFLKRYGFI